MATSTVTQYEHLEPRPGSNYRQLFLKGRRIHVANILPLIEAERDREAADVRALGLDRPTQP